MQKRNRKSASLSPLMNTVFCFLSCLLLHHGYGQTNSAIECILRGELIDRPQTSYLILHKQNDDLRLHGIPIPVVDGKFHYVLNCDYEEQYGLTFNDEFEVGSYRPVPFFAENATISFVLNASGRSKENKPQGGKLTGQYWDYMQPLQDKFDKAEKEFLAKAKLYIEERFGNISNTYATDEENINAKLEQLSAEGVDVDPVIRKLSEMERSIGEEVAQKARRQTLDFIKKNPTIVGYSVLLSETNTLLQRNQLRDEVNDLSPYADLYQNVFASLFSHHPYSEQMENLFAGAAIKAGARYVDFTAQDFKGMPVKLSERIAGKAAVLNLWASWCGPCRKNGKELIPVYEEFKDRDFVVVGVAREKEISVAVKAVAYDKYPWENLVELNDAERIWEKYGIGNSGGMIFLIDENGIIVSTNPSAEEVRGFLKERDI